MTNLTPKQAAFVRAARSAGYTRTISRPQVEQVAAAAGLNMPQWLTNDAAYRAGRGLYRLPSLEGDAPAVAPAPAPVAVAAPAVPTVAAAPAVKTVDAVPTVAPTMDASLAFMGGASLVPDRLPTYVPFGAHRDVAAVVKSRRFYPVYITGLSGNGKTTTVEQACAENNREFYRVNITPETSEDDLLGGFRLVNGETVWVDGPVIVSMKRGGILLLDEVDLGTVKIMCLQPVLEGKPVFLKKTNTWVKPAPGFNVFLTGNTKGRGDDTGKFVGTNAMNEAFLDRVPETVEQDYPTEAVETKIVRGVLKYLGVEDQDDFAVAIVKWAQTIRKTYAEGAVDDVVTTRRLVQAANALSIYGDRLKAIEKVTTRFDAATRASFIDLYKKLDAEADGGENTEALGEAPTSATASTSSTDPHKCPF
jgi:MoxR-like ATPase